MVPNYLIFLVSLSCLRLARTSEQPPTSVDLVSQHGDTSCTGSDEPCGSANACKNSGREGCGTRGTTAIHHGRVRRRDGSRNEGQPRAVIAPKYECPLNYTAYISTGCNRNVRCNGVIVSVNWILSAHDCIPEYEMNKTTVTGGFAWNIQDRLNFQLSQTVRVNDSRRRRSGSQLTLYKLFREDAAPGGGFLPNVCVKGWLFQIYNATVDSLVNIFWFYGEEPFVYTYVKPDRPFRVLAEKDCGLNFGNYRPEEFFCVKTYKSSDPNARIGAPVLVNYDEDLGDVRIIGMVCEIEPANRIHLICKMTEEVITWLQKITL